MVNSHCTITLRIAKNVANSNDAPVGNITLIGRTSEKNPASAFFGTHNTGGKRVLRNPPVINATRRTTAGAIVATITINT